MLKCWLAVWTGSNRGTNKVLWERRGDEGPKITIPVVYAPFALTEGVCGCGLMWVVTPVDCARVQMGEGHLCEQPGESHCFASVEGLSGEDCTSLFFWSKKYHEPRMYLWRIIPTKASMVDYCESICGGL